MNSLVGGPKRLILVVNHVSDAQRLGYPPLSLRSRDLKAKVYIARIESCDGVDGHCVQEPCLRELCHVGPCFRNNENVLLQSAVQSP